MTALALQVLSFINYAFNWFGSVACKFVLGEGCSLLRVAKHLSVFLPLQKINEPHLYEQIVVKVVQEAQTQGQQAAGSIGCKIEKSGDYYTLLSSVMCLMVYLNTDKVELQRHRKGLNFCSRRHNLSTTSVKVHIKKICHGLTFHDRFMVYSFYFLFSFFGCALSSPEPSTVIVCPALIGLT